MAATALARQYEQLGFRVIEGGKSGNIALLKTPGITEMFGVAHRNVLRDIREFQESGGSNLSSEFAEHCRPTQYRDSRGKDQPCFELTKVGFATVAAKYDDELRFRLALAFDALERDDGYAGALIIQQINARIRALRGRATGQDELAFNAPVEITPHPSEWSPSYAAWRNGIIESSLPRPAASEDDDDDEQDSSARQVWRAEQMPILTRDDLPIEHSPEIWKAWARENWYRIPLHLRRRWWRDTDYGRRLPSQEVMNAIYHYYATP
jgi:Rha family phage regulatory protein